MKLSIPYNKSGINPISKFVHVERSPIHGLGLFAKVKIPKGTIWWHARPQDVLIITKTQFQTIESSRKTDNLESYIKVLLTYSYYERNLDALVFCLDDAKFCNHSFNDNSGAIDDENGFCSVSLRDIEPGEEITEDYSKYTLCGWLQAYREFFDPCCW